MSAVAEPPLLGWVARIGMALARPRWALALAGNRRNAGRSGSDLVMLLLALVVVSQLRVLIGAVWLGAALDLGLGARGVMHVLAGGLTVDLAFLVIGALVVWAASRGRQPLGRAVDLACVAAMPLVVVEHGAGMLLQAADVMAPPTVAFALWGLACGWAAALLALAARTPRVLTVPMPPAADVRPGRVVGRVLVALVVVALGAQTVWVVRHLDWVKPVGAGGRAPVVALHEITQAGTLGPVHAWPTGKVVVLDFWATWCGPCVHALPHLQELATRHASDVEVLAINIDDAEAARALFARLGLTVALLADDGPTSQRYGVREIPHTVVIGRDGTVRVVLRGGRPADLDAAVAAAVALRN